MILVCLGRQFVELDVLALAQGLGIGEFVHDAYRSFSSFATPLNTTNEPLSPLLPIHTNLSIELLVETISLCEDNRFDTLSLSAICWNTDLVSIEHPCNPPCDHERKQSGHTGDEDRRQL